MLKTLGDLSPEEFQDFSNEIVEILFKKKINGFSEGPDGGIDGIDDSVNPKIIVQSKRVEKKSNGLVKIAEKEIDKINNTAKRKNYSDFQYVFVTSSNISVSGYGDIRRYAKKLMDNDDNIIDRKKLLKFSKDKAYSMVFKKFGLIQVNLFDKKLEEIEYESRQFLDHIDSKYFVKTESFECAYSELCKEHIVLLQGGPGVGKTMSSEMLAKTIDKNMDKDCIVLKRNVDDIKKIKQLYFNIFLKNDDLVMLVIFDDFLGRNSMETTDGELKIIRDICMFAKREKNFYIILNGRTQITQKAITENIEFKSLIDDNDDGINTSLISIDLTEMKRKEKASILRNSFEKSYNNVNNNDDDQNKLKSNYDELRENRQYNQIIDSINWNPRLVNEISKHWKDAELKNGKTFFDYVCGILKNPTSLYDELFKKLSKKEQEFLMNLLSFENYPTQKTIVEKAFLEIEPSDYLKDIENNLNKSWILFELDNGKEKIDFINPSIIDYLLQKKNSIEEFLNLIQNKTTFLQQIPKLIGNAKLYDFIISNLDRFEDSEEFIGEQLNVLLDNEDNFDEKRFGNLLYQFNGNFYDRNGIGTKKIRDWEYLLEKISNANNNNAKKIFTNELLFGDHNEELIENILLSTSNISIDAIAEYLNIIIIDVYKEGLSQSETIDFGEEETGINIYTSVVQRKKELLQESLDDGHAIFEMETNVLDIVNDGNDPDDVEDAVNDYAIECENKIRSNLGDNEIFSESQDLVDELDFSSFKEDAEDQATMFLENDESYNHYAQASIIDDVDSILDKPLDNRKN